MFAENLKRCVPESLSPCAVETYFRAQLIFPRDSDIFLIPTSIIDSKSANDTCRSFYRCGQYTYYYHVGFSFRSLYYVLTLLLIRLVKIYRYLFIPYRYAKRVLLFIRFVVSFYTLSRRACPGAWRLLHFFFSVRFRTRERKNDLGPRPFISSWFLNFFFYVRQMAIATRRSTFKKKKKKISFLKYIFSVQSSRKVKYLQNQVDTISNLFYCHTNIALVLF